MIDEVQAIEIEIEGTSLPPVRIFGDSSTFTVGAKRRRRGDRDGVDGRLSLVPALLEAATLHSAIMPGDAGMLTITF